MEKRNSGKREGTEYIQYINVTGESKKDEEM
jgi:hypothetical protein